MRIGSRVIPLPAVGAAAAAVIAVIVVVVVVVASGGGDDDDGGGGETSSSNRTAVAQSRTRIPLTSTAIAEARLTAIAEGTPEDAFDEGNPTPTAVPVQSGDPTAPPGGGSPVPGATNTALPLETATAAATPTDVPAGVVGDVTMDSNPGTPDVDHTEVTAAAGATFDIGIAISEGVEPYAGYQYAIAWDDNGVLAVVSEQRVEPAGLTICTELVEDAFTDEDDDRAGVYGGCLAAEGTVNHTGRVATLTLRCDAAGRIALRLVALNPSEPFATSLLAQGGDEIPTEVDNGFDVVCT